MLTSAMQLVANAYVQKKYPISLVHFVTNRCNARCTHCFLDFDNPAIFAGDLTLEEITRLTRHLGPSLFNVNLTGGEPLLRKDLWDIADAYLTHSTARSIFITTNGYFTDRTQTLIDQFLASAHASRATITLSFSIDNFEERHNANRRLKGLFARTIETFRLVQGYQQANVMGNIGLTVTDHNYDDVVSVYEYLKNDLGIDAFTATVMREEGVVRHIDPDVKRKIHQAYAELTTRIHADQRRRVTQGYKRNLQGALMNAKNRLVNGVIETTYLDPHFVSYCPAGAMFGVIGNDGMVYPCEILDKPLGNLRDYQMDFMALWSDRAAAEAKRFIRETHCHCTYECAWTINILSHPKFIPQLVVDSIRQRF